MYQVEAFPSAWKKQVGVRAALPHQVHEFYQKIFRMLAKRNESHHYSAVIIKLL